MLHSETLKCLQVALIALILGLVLTTQLRGHSGSVYEWEILNTVPCSILSLNQN